MTQQLNSFDRSQEISAAVDLRIMETTDLHVHLHPYDYYADCPNPDLGLARLAELIDHARQQVPNCLLFDNGDFLQGTPVGDFFAYDRGVRTGEVHPVIAAMNALRYDAITLGNHEFNYGLEFLMGSLSQAQFPTVSANILRKTGRAPLYDQHLFRPYRLLQRDVVDRAGRSRSICVGVIGVAPAQITLWERQHLDGRIQTRDMVDSVTAWVPEMREAGADIVVVLAHSGIGESQHIDLMENAVSPLARIEGVDLILCGHSHQVFPSPRYAGVPGVDIERGTIWGTPTVMSGFFGSHLGLIDMTLLQDGGKWHIVDTQVTTRALREASLHFAQPAPLEGLMPLHSPAVRKIVASAHDAVLDKIRQPVGQSETAINSFFAYLGRNAATALVAHAQTEFVSNHLKHSVLGDLPLLSAVSPAKVGGFGGARNFTNIDAGMMTLRALADLYVFPNRIAACRVNGAEVLLWLERSASAFRQLEPGKGEQDLIDSAFPGYNFEIIYGLDYSIDLMSPARFGPDGREIDPSNSRIRDVTWNGVPLDMNAEFVLCTNSFRAQGAGGFAGTGFDGVVLEHPAITRDILCNYVKNHSPLNIPVQSPFRLRTEQGTSAILRTGVAAHGHLDLIADFAPEILGVDKDGFLQVKVCLDGPQFN
ncbi:bifunctional 2',3'-cyclic-nucleotide 2'-phosphodiesterase/3'-nucleotidase [Roseinatronobacter sp.]|uniref:bifunctional 2',3'-cyclic-nucleotide 2'-phosphodiesterase/3'-nucleotidase n=1 Tax=Roseinatronobacter sp. TaxID=1945755 RepID=UPI0025DE176B|nr:bifunctional 2',3'-cyclic-nucleotide 2'-phosphodiesterase/3'-nucleotidase [Rhodobaca sp.]